MCYAFSLSVENSEMCYWCLPWAVLKMKDCLRLQIEVLKLVIGKIAIELQKAKYFHIINPKHLITCFKIQFMDGNPAVVVSYQWNVELKDVFWMLISFLYINFIVIKTNFLIKTLVFEKKLNVFKDFDHLNLKRIHLLSGIVFALGV